MLAIFLYMYFPDRGCIHPTHLVCLRHCMSVQSLVCTLCFILFPLYVHTVYVFIVFFTFLTFGELSSIAIWTLVNRQRSVSEIARKYCSKFYRCVTDDTCCPTY